MTCKLSSKVGYRGQMYEASCLGFDRNNPELRTVVGWTDDPTGGGLVRMIEKHPVWNSPQIKKVSDGTEDKY